MQETNALNVQLSRQNSNARMQSASKIVIQGEMRMIPPTKLNRKCETTILDTRLKKFSRPCIRETEKCAPSQL